MANVSWTILMDAKTKDQWTAVQTLLPKGYMAIEIGDKTKIKVGDGTKTFAQLPYIESEADLSNYYTIEQVDNKIVDAMTKAFILKGTVDSVENLPKTDNKIGDLYIVNSEAGNAAEYVWTGTAWEYMGQTFTVDLSNYYTSTQVDTKLSGKADKSHTHTATEVTGLATVATSGKYSDLTGKPTIDSALSTTSTNAVQNKVINAKLTTMQTAIDGKASGTHTHSYNDLDDLPTIDTELNATSTHAVQNKAIATAINGKADSDHNHAAADITGLSKVATSNKYSDLDGKPTIDSALSSTSTNAVQNKVINSKISTLETAINGKASSTHTHSYNDLTDTPTIDTDLSTTSSNAVENKSVTTKINELETTINGKADGTHTHAAADITGLATVATSGKYSDLTGRPTIDTKLSTTSTNAVQNKVVTAAINGKAAASHTHEIDDVNGLSDELALFIKTTDKLIINCVIE